MPLPMCKNIRLLRFASILSIVSQRQQWRLRNAENRLNTVRKEKPKPVFRSQDRRQKLRKIIICCQHVHPVFCKSRPNGLQKATFRTVKGLFSRGERMPFTDGYDCPHKKNGPGILVPGPVFSSGKTTCYFTCWRILAKYCFIPSASLLSIISSNCFSSVRIWLTWSWV